MKFPTSLFLLLTFVLFGGTNTFAQKKRKIKTEKAIRVCEGIALEDRPRITVGSFSISRVSARREVGEELSSMLSNALQATECFQVLESFRKMEDIRGEIDLAESTYSDQNQAAQRGQMMGAQLIVSGEITEYAVGGTKLIGIGANTAHIGFILKVVDPQDRSIVWSKSVERKVTKPALKVLGANLAVFGSAAMGDAVERAVLEAVDLILDNKPLFADYQLKRAEEIHKVESLFTLYIKDVDFGGLSKVEKFIKTISGATFLRKGLEDGKGVISLQFNGSVDDLAAKLSENPAIPLSITGLSGNDLDLILK